MEARERRGLRARFGRWRRAEDGVSAVEFALIAPMLFFALLATADLGLALNERMTIDHVLRAGAQPAMQDRGAAAVLATLRDTASNNFSVAAVGESPAAGEIAVDVLRFCACPNAPLVQVNCTATCAGTPATQVSVYYRLTAQRTYNGLFLPLSFFGFTLGEIEFAPTILVQTR